MEKVSMFATGLDFASKGSKLGTKVTNSTRPEVTRDYTKDGFTLNDKARRALAVVVGVDRVCMIDMDAPVEFAEGQVARFFIHKGYKVGETVHGNKIGKTGSFSSAINWTSMLLNKDGEVGCKNDELVRLGLGSINVTASGAESFSADSKTSYGLVSVGETVVARDENQEPVAYAEVFALVEPSTTERSAE